MMILALETSCDETAAAIVEDGCRVVTSCIASSQDTFHESGGVIPEEAARKQVECIVPIVRTLLRDYAMPYSSIDAIAVTKGPGLSGSLLVGTTAARVLSSLWKCPIVGVHHTLGHLSSPWIECSPEPQFPVLTLSVSGGHSDLWYRTSHTKGKLLGSTRDDAAGEAFDKGAAMLSLPYPGGPSIQRAGAGGNRTAFPFPKPLHHEEGLDFSFSGLKTALKYTLRDLPTESSLAALVQDLAASYEHAVCRHLVEKLEKAVELFPTVKEVHIVGGVSANSHLRSLAEDSLKGYAIRYPQKISYCTDNAAMIGCAAHFLIQELGDAAFTPFTTEVSLPLSDVIQS